MASNYKFLENPLSRQWMILAPRRAKRPNEAEGLEPLCPFCPREDDDEEEVYRVGGQAGDNNWKVRVVNNKFPFAPIHEVIIHSQDHRKGFDELAVSQTLLVLETYRQRYRTHQNEGQVYIFNNHGMASGESLPHPHSQLAVIPKKVKLDIPTLEVSQDYKNPKETEFYSIFSPLTSQWPDEIWIRPVKRGRVFGETEDLELSDLAKSLYRLIQIFNLRHGSEFPFNFYIYPGGDWYLRIIPRVKILGGFELGTGVLVNTQDPLETNKFIHEHFDQPDHEEIKHKEFAKYKKGV